MSVILICLALICNVMGNGGGALGKPGNSEYFLSYLDNSLATWPIFSQSQGKPFSKNHANVAMFVDGDQDSNLAGWPTLDQNQDDPSNSKSHSTVVRIVDGDRLKQLLPTSQSNTLLGYLLEELKEKTMTAEKPERASKCTVENNLKISSSFKEDEITKKLEELLERYSDTILRQTERLISENHVELQDKIFKIFEEKTETIASNVVDKLFGSMENKLITPFSNGSFSTQYPNLHTEEEVATIPSFDEVMETTPMYNPEASEEMSTNITSSGRDNVSESLFPNLVEGEGDGKGENETKFSRTPQQMPSGIPEPNLSPFYVGVNRPSYINSNPHGLRRRPQSGKYPKPHL